jgi:hypothetical protein
MADVLIHLQGEKINLVKVVKKALGQAFELIKQSISGYGSEVGLEETLKGSNAFFNQKLREIKSMIVNQAKVAQAELKTFLKEELVAVEKAIAEKDPQETINLTDKACDKIIGNIDNFN